MEQMEVINVVPHQRRQDRTLGLVQAAILTVVNRGPKNAYGSAITDEVSKLVGREFADAQIYMALQRLEGHGLLASRIDEIPVPSRRTRGRPRKYYALTAKGRRALESVGRYVLSARPVMQSASGGNDEDEASIGPTPTPVMV